VSPSVLPTVTTVTPSTALALSPTLLAPITASGCPRRFQDIMQWSTLMQLLLLVAFNLP
jgi:hypothetical protein